MPSYPSTLRPSSGRTWRSSGDRFSAQDQPSPSVMPPSVLRFWSAVLGATHVSKHPVVEVEVLGKFPGRRNPVGRNQRDRIDKVDPSRLKAAAPLPLDPL